MAIGPLTIGYFDCSYLRLADCSHVAALKGQCTGGGQRPRYGSHQPLLPWRDCTAVAYYLAGVSGNIYSRIHSDGTWEPDSRRVLCPEGAIHRRRQHPCYDSHQPLPPWRHCTAFGYWPLTIGYFDCSYLRLADYSPVATLKGQCTGPGNAPATAAINLCYPGGIARPLPITSRGYPGIYIPGYIATGLASQICGAFAALKGQCTGGGQRPRSGSHQPLLS